MPELPEAEVVLQQLQGRILGSTIHRIWIGREDIVRSGLSTKSWYLNASIQKVERRGKSIVMTCGQKNHSRYIVAELGMTGLFLFRQGSPHEMKHTHLVLFLKGGLESELRYWNARRFGRVYLLDADGLENFLGRRFGPDPFEMEEARFVSLIKGCRGRIKPLLLNQQKVAGIGNIYANEILYRARVHPHAQGHRLSRQTIRRLFGTMREVLHEAVQLGGSTIRDFRAPDGTPGQFQDRHLVYQKAGQPCPRGCGTSVRCLVAERRSFFCPTCQKRA